MKTLIKTLLLSVALLLSVSAVNAINDEVTIVIDFGNQKETQQVKLNWHPEMTALEALQSVAVVETHPVGKYIIVTAINGTKGIRGEKAWYYTVNDKPTHKVAFSLKVNKGDTIRWIYKEDVCSKTVDCKK